ncbi:peptidase M3 [Chitinimonas arctica]|uniref:Peptidase M3 n=1 Tax=Chitinimonas arctica TaxID=2594795 RepID=A0A516SBJ6_9NEIS|nr:M3 family metallopeptidase [Chitinimonas arctica]QDQ25522.1 peptidase M3 [Chitinimonas arctica]
MENARQFFEQLNRDYLAVHKHKEDLFWSTYMATSDDHAGFAQAEQAYKDFISAPDRLAETRAHLASLDAAPESADRDALRHGLQGWLALFESNIVDNETARTLMRELIETESALFAKRQQLTLQHINEQGEREDASLSMLATNLSMNPQEASRRSSFESLRSLETWVLENGYLDIVRLRNRFARSLGFRDYFDYKVRKNEQMSPETLFGILDDFETRTRAANTRALQGLRTAHGEDAAQPWNLRFHMNGDVLRRMDPYVTFGKGLRRWVESFRRLGIQYRGATMQLDLLERKGKYQNGFCHGPIPSYFDERGNWIAAQINFTAEAKPDQVGSGWRALNTLFHEGGHAAHFANVTQNSPCFSQEFAPTSMAYAETQSMFCDSLLEDADWLKRYAVNETGEAIPDELIRARIETSQPFAAYNERSIAVVSYFESALYGMDERELTPAGVLALARATEQRVLGVESPRPMLSIPHLLNQESAAAYHGYLLAHMAVYQTRAYFLERFGYLTDNPAIGPLLSQHYWGPGNSINHNATLLSLTGEGFSARYLAEKCNLTVDAAWQSAQASIAAAKQRDYSADYPAQLDAIIRIVHGDQVLADNSVSETAMCADFEQWVASNYPATIH